MFSIDIRYENDLFKGLAQSKAKKGSVEQKIADLMDSDNNVLYLGQSGLGLGNRDYYLNEENAALREGYQNFLTKVFSLAGYEDAAQRAADAEAFGIKEGDAMFRITGKSRL